MTTNRMSFGARAAALASEHPDEPAVVFVPERGPERTLTRAHLDAEATRVARMLAGRGVRPGSLIAVGLRNSPEHVVCTIAAWRVGCTVLPLRWDLPPWELGRMLDVARPALVVAAWDGADVSPADLAAASALSAEPLPDVVPDAPIAIGTGGSTGTPKIVLMPSPGDNVPGSALGPLGEWMGLGQDLRHLICGPLYHGNPFGMTHIGLFERHTIVLMERFDAARAVELIERHRVGFCTLVPTMMQRILRVDGVGERDLSSLVAVLHTAAACPPWVKHGFIDLIGPERVYEAFGSSEAVGYIVNRGDEWLTRPGTIGRPFRTEVRILDDEQRGVPTGTLGEIYMRLEGTAGPAYRYIGSAPARQTPDGFVSVGDLGWVDADGWLYSADRRVDMIVSGGANVYPAEVEAALSEHPGVDDVVVVGVADAEWGRRVHAVVVARAGSVSEDDLRDFCRQRLAAYKVPKSFEFAADLPRNPMGKIRRSEVATQREQ